MSDGDSRGIPDTMSLFGRFYEGLDLLAPGDNTLTKDAFHRILPLPDKPRILDIGCGTGRSALALAEICPEARIEAIDVYQPFLDKVEEKAASRGLNVTTRRLSMEALSGEIEEESADLIWSEGAAYVMGFEQALKTWRDFLRPEGAMVVSELCWLTDDPPEEAAAFWKTEYPDMVDVEETVARAKRAGFRVFDSIILPGEAWAAYYKPLAARCAALKDSADEQLRALALLTMREMEIFNRYEDSYGYVLFLMRRK